MCFDPYSRGPLFSFPVYEYLVLWFHNCFLVNNPGWWLWICMIRAPSFKSNWLVSPSSYGICHSTRYVYRSNGLNSAGFQNSLISRVVPWHSISTPSRLNLYPSWSSWTGMRDFVFIHPSLTSEAFIAIHALDFMHNFVSFSSFELLFRFRC